MPVVSAKARARITAIFFMAVPPSWVMSRLSELGKDIRDRHHVLELFGKSPYLMNGLPCALIDAEGRGLCTYAVPNAFRRPCVR